MYTLLLFLSFKDKRWKEQCLLEKATQTNNFSSETEKKVGGIIEGRKKHYPCYSGQEEIQWSNHFWIKSGVMVF